MQRTRRTDILRWQMLPAPHARDWAAGPSRRGVGRLFAWLERSKMRTRMPLSFEDDRRRALRREPGGVAQRGGFATRKAVQPSKRQAQFPVRVLRGVFRRLRAYAAFRRTGSGTGFEPAELWPLSANSYRAARQAREADRPVPGNRTEQECVH